MSWKDDRASIAALLKESWSVFFPRAPKLAACFLPFALLGGVASITFSFSAGLDRDPSPLPLLDVLLPVYGLVL